MIEKSVERTTIHLTPKARQLAERNINNFSEWVNDKIVEEFDSLPTLKARLNNLMLEAKDISEKISKKEIERMINMEKEEQRLAEEKRNEKEEKDKQDKLQRLIDISLKKVKKAGATKTEEIVLILNKIRDKELDLEVQTLFNQSYPKIIRLVDDEGKEDKVQQEV